MDPKVLKYIWDYPFYASCSPYLASGSTDKSIKVWKLSYSGNDYLDISEECNFTNEESGIRKIIFLKNQPHLLLAGDLVCCFRGLIHTLISKTCRLKT